MYNYATVSLYHFASFGLKMTLRYRLDTATCYAFGMFSLLMCYFLPFLILRIRYMLICI